jgi:hypothetical protein
MLPYDRLVVTVGSGIRAGAIERYRHQTVVPVLSLQVRYEEEVNGPSSVAVRCDIRAIYSVGRDAFDARYPEQTNRRPGGRALLGRDIRQRARCGNDLHSL